jgi:hypothetical protein
MTVLKEVPERLTRHLFGDGDDMRRHNLADNPVMRRAHRRVLPSINYLGGIRPWIVKSRADHPDFTG